MSDDELPRGSDFGSDDELPEPLADKEGDELIVTDDGGIVKKIVKPGQGWETPESGSDVQVHYVGTLLDGTKFDSSRDRGEPFSFKIGQGQVIKGWDQGVAKMKKGETAVLTCKPDYAYGAAGSPPKIPPDSTLQFEVELLSWTSDKDISKAGKDRVKPALLKKTVTEGANSWDHPKFGTKVKFSAKCIKGDGPSFEDKEIVIGEDQAPKVIERSIKNLAAGEKAIITAKGGSRYVDAAEDVQWEVSLEPFEKPKETWNMSAEEKIEGANKLKDEGNASFKSGNLKLAARKYKHATKFVESDYNCSDEEKKQMGEVLATIAGNAAAVAISRKDWPDALSNADKALKKNPQNHKALMRRGKAHNELNDWDKALSDLEAARDLAAGDTASLSAIKAEIAKVHAKQKLQAQKEKKLFGNMFEKMSRMEPEEPAAAAAPVSTSTPPSDAPPAAPVDEDAGITDG